MSKITLKDVVNEHLIKDLEFREHYQKELLINEISKLIVELRKEAHLTQAELAKKADTTQPVIARLESGANSRIPSLELLARVAKAVNTELHIKFEKKPRAVASM